MKPKTPVITGEYNRWGYYIYQDGAELFHCGNHRHDSTVIERNKKHAVPLWQLRSWCIKEARIFAQARGFKYGGVERVETL